MSTRSAQASTRQAGTLRWLPYIAAAATVATVFPLAWDRGFGTFLMYIFFGLPVLLLTSIGLCIWAIIERKSPRGRSIVLALIAIPLLMGVTIYLVPRFKDEIRFLVWSRIHANTLSEYAKKDAIILDWEGWGMAGMENDSYLVSNPADNLTETGAASEWPRRVGSSCEIVATKRMARALYIVTTYNCPLR